MAKTGTVAVDEPVAPASSGAGGLGSFVVRRRALLLGALVAVFALVVGYLGGLLEPRFTAPGDNSPAMVAWHTASDPEVRQIAYDIATVQENQIGTMQNWLVTWHLSPTGSRPKMAWMPNGTKELLPDGRMPGMASDAELQQLESATGSKVDVLFCQLMLRHHLGGIHMADAIISLSHDQPVVDLATTMKGNQQGEVTILKQILDRMHAQPLPS
ncbi:MAG: DUF305 domain-containing protein [Actinobacteria bacterium]|nr:MAG: DUF305 domain-containing protein [Actinomycetota bacterium]